jgi:ACS family glucarate transporter-like MFS transporter
VNGPDEPSLVARPTRARHLVLVALLAITAVNYAQRNAISPAATTIEAGLGLTGPQLDLAAGAFFLTYTLFQVPSGWLAQRWGPRLTLPLYAACWSLALAGCAVASGLGGLYLGRLAMGAFQAGIFPCATLILAVWYPASRRGLATALLNSFMLLGSAGGNVVTGALLGPVGWRGVFLAYAVPGLLWAAWFAWWFRDRPRDHPGVNNAELALLAAGRPSAPDKGITLAPRLTAGAVLLSLPLILLCAQQACRAAASRLFDSRLPTYFERERGATAAEAAVLASLPQWLGVFGGLVGGALSDHVLRRTGSRRWARKGVTLFGLAAAVLVYLTAYFIRDVTLAAVVLAAGAFLFSFSSPCAFAAIMDMSGRHLALVFGLANMLGNLGAFAFVSSVMTLVGWGGWELALGAWLGLHLIAIVCWVFLDPSVTLGEGGRGESGLP